MVRATQGRSFAVDRHLIHTWVEPTGLPEALFHGTTAWVYADIEKTGLLAGGQQHEALRLTTANVTSWKKDILQWHGQLGGILAVQELHLDQAALQQLRIEAHKQGYHLFTPACIQRWGCYHCSGGPSGLQVRYGSMTLHPQTISTPLPRPVHPTFKAEVLKGFEKWLRTRRFQVITHLDLKNLSF